MSERRTDLAELTLLGLRSLSHEIADDLGRPPTLPEMLEVLTWGLRALSGDPFSDLHPSDVIALRVRRGRGSAARSPGRARSLPSVAELGDASFVAASDLFLTLARDRGARARHLTRHELCALLQEGFASAGEFVEGVPASGSWTLTVDVRRRSRPLVKVGDLVTIPCGRGRHVTAIVVARNQFGTAFGVFREALPSRPSPRVSPLDALPYPVYSDESFVESRRWKIVGHDTRLLRRFPRDPEIYHYPDPDDPSSEVGRNGAAETASGRLRKLTREEARKVGLLSKEYRQTYLPDLLEQRLEGLLRPG